MPVYRHESRLEHPVSDVFAWHRRPGAFERLTPPWMDARVVEREGGVEGGRVVLEVRRGPVPIRWELRHEDYEEDRQFRDVQVSGPFSSWVHTHRFREDGPDGCLLEDAVEWEPPLGSLTEVLAEPVMRRVLPRIFRFRHERLRNDLDRHRDGAGAGVGASLRPREGSGGGPEGRAGPGEAPAEVLTVAITGASGLVGSSLRHFLTTGGHRVRAVVRSREAASGDDIYWSVEDGQVEAEKLEGLDAVVHLAGEPLFSFRWSESKKRRIRESRVRGTELLARTLAGLDDPPPALVSASGINYYGSRGDERLTEASSAGSGFLAEVCREWEAATAPAERAGIRVVHLRTAPVLTPAGGALGAMLPAFKLALGGRVGSGRQYMSWIDADDHVGLILKSIRDGRLEGPLNAAAPHPVTNATFTDTLGRVLGRPTLLRVPRMGVEAVLGEMGRETALVSLRVFPRNAERHDFDFFYPDLEESLRFQLGRME